MSEMEQESEPRQIAIPPLTLGWRLQMAMAQGGRSREYMAARCGVAASTISRWLHDQGVRPPRRGDLQIFADEGNVPIGWLEECLNGDGPSFVTGQYLPEYLRPIAGEGDTTPRLDRFTVGLRAVS